MKCLHKKTKQQVAFFKELIERKKKKKNIILALSLQLELILVL